MLEITQDLAFERREWRASRLLWVALMLVMLATALGLFGGGPLSRAHAESADGSLRAEFSRFGRFGAAMRLTVHARPGADGIVSLALSRPLLDGFRIDAIAPAPLSTEATADGAEYRFASRAATDVPVVFSLQPVRRWRIDGEVRSGGAAVRLAHFIYP